MIPILDTKAQYQAIKTEIDAAVAAVIESGSFILGPNVKALEQALAEYTATRKAVGVASGTDALRLSLAALGAGAGDEVITTPFTFVASANTISRAGATPVFVDIDPRTFNLDPDAVARAVTPRTKGIVVVHLYGQPAAMDDLQRIADQHGLWILEDCAQAIGARWRGTPVGALGVAGCYSFYPTKNLGAYGDGGLVATNDLALGARVEQLRRHGGKDKYNVEVLGYNSRLDELQAAILGVKLRYLPAWTHARQAVAQRYDALLHDTPVTTPFVAPDAEHVYHQYTIRAPERDALAAHLRDHGIGTMVYYPVPLHRQPLYAPLGLGPGAFPQAEAAAASVLSLPIFPELTAEQQTEIAGVIRGFYAAGGA